MSESALDVPTCRPYSPGSTTYLFVASSKNASVAACTLKVTVLLWPGFSVTFWNASSRLIGRCAEAGSNGVVTYSCGTADPAAVPSVA